MNQYLTLYRGRFALLRHVSPKDIDSGNLASVASCPTQQDHYDLLVETDAEQLLAWRISELPSNFVNGSLPDSRRAGDTTQYPFNTVAERIPNHRVKYLDYEGPISNNRGSVIRCSHGNYLTHCISNRFPVHEEKVNKHTSCFTGSKNDSIAPLSLELIENFSSSSQQVALSFVLRDLQRFWLLTVQMTPIGTMSHIGLCSMSLLMGLQMTDGIVGK